MGYVFEQLKELVAGGIFFAQSSAEIFEIRKPKISPTNQKSWLPPDYSPRHFDPYRLTARSTDDTELARKTEFNSVTSSRMRRI